jgi:hypothetical protein
MDEENSRKSSPPNESKSSDTVKVALIGAAATVLVAVISGLFTLWGRESARIPTPLIETPIQAIVLAEPTATPTATPTETATTTPAPTFTPTPVPTATPEPIKGLQFTTQIAPDGRALAPDTTFSENVSDLYAVFRPGETPPGITVVAQNPDPNAYYTYLRSTGNPPINTFGWRWFKDGVVVNEYEADATAGTFWLQIFDQGGGPLFDALAGPGAYRVVILLDGNPSLSAEIQVLSEE